MECSELEAAGRVQYEALQQETVTLWQRLIASHPDVVLAVLGHAFESSSGNAAPLGVWDTEAHLVLLAPDLAALPERYPTTTAAGNLSLRNFTKGEMADLYKQLVAGLVLATAKETFSVGPGSNWHTDCRPPEHIGRCLWQDPPRSDSGGANCSSGAEWRAMDESRCVHNS
jgi:hypothetical protein